MFMLWMMVQRSSAAAGASRTGMASTPSSLSPTGVASAFTARFSRLTLALVLAEVALSAAGQFVTGLVHHCGHSRVGGLRLDVYKKRKTVPVDVLDVGGVQLIALVLDERRVG